MDADSATASEVDLWWRSSTYDLEEVLTSAIVANEHVRGEEGHHGRGGKPCESEKIFTFKKSYLYGICQFS